MKLRRSNLWLTVLLFFLSQYNYSQDVPYVPTPYEVVEGMLSLAQVKSGDIVYDLGCGDGRIVVVAAKKYGATGLGVDSNPDRIKESNQNAKDNQVTDKVEFRQQNLFETDLSRANVVTLYLLSSVNLKLRPKLLEELKPGTRVVSNTFDMDEWRPDDQKVVSGRNLYLWIIPANVSGRWNWTNNKENYTLDLNQDFQNVSGTISVGEEKYNLSNVKLYGDKLTFSLTRNNENIKFEGVARDNTVTWKVGGQEIAALRQANTMRPLIQTASK